MAVSVNDCVDFLMIDREPMVDWWYYRWCYSTVRWFSDSILSWGWFRFRFHRMAAFCRIAIPEGFLYWWSFVVSWFFWVLFFISTFKFYSSFVIKLAIGLWRFSLCCFVSVQFEVSKFRSIFIFDFFHFFVRYVMGLMGGVHYWLIEMVRYWLIGEAIFGWLQELLELLERQPPLSGLELIRCFIFR